MMMRIGIEAQRLFRPHKHGMDRVALELIKNLQEIDKVNDYFIFTKPDQDSSVIQNTLNFKIVEIPGGFYPFWEQFRLPKIAKEYNCDILHCTSNTAPYSKQTPLITTLHDIIYMESSIFKTFLSSASLYQKLGNLYRRIVVPKIVNSSRKLITVSNFEKQNITRFFKLKSKNIRTIHNGVSERFKSEMDTYELNKVKAKYKLPDQYLLHIANSDPRKNTKRVLLAFKEFLSLSKQNYQLVILGCKDETLKGMLHEIGAISIYKRVFLVGYVSDEDLPKIYHLSKIFLFPSLREGFGIPIIEAMACGVPVITSNTSSMPEVAGNAAHIIDPYKTNSICNAMLKIVSDDGYKNQLVQRGLIQSKQFSWNRMAFQVLELYKNLYKEINT